MSEIRALTPDEFEPLARIFAEAYPGFKITTEEERKQFAERALKLHEEDPTAQFHGLFRDGELQGIMCFYDFSMNFLQARIPAGGVGQVAVALLHKKEHVAKEMMGYFLRHYRNQGAPLAALYPFRPDFYRKMGFGYGTKMNQYRIKPTAFPKGPSKARVRTLTEDDRDAVVACYSRFVDQTHGMMEKREREVRRLFAAPRHRIVGCEIDGEIRAYMVFTFEEGENFILNDIQVQELIYENAEALSELSTLLHSQADQIRHVILNTQDEYFHYLLLDPRNDSGRLIPDVYHETNAQGVGLMYRVIGVPRIFDLLRERDFGGQTCTLKLTVVDSFLPENSGSTMLQFQDGRVQRNDYGAHDVEIRLDVAEFSSLLAGSVDFYSLVRYGLADISDPAYVEAVSRIFAVERKPICTTSF
jgi:predicted acetyltransferase